MEKIMQKIHKKTTEFIGNGGWLTILVFGGLGLIFAIVGHYGTMGFNWKWFLFFELPLYCFMGWAIYQIFKMIKNHPDVFR